MSVISNFIVISLFLNKLSSNLVYMRTKLKGTRSANKYIAQNLILFTIFYKRAKLDSDFGGFFSQTPVKNWVTMATA